MMFPRAAHYSLGCSSCGRSTRSCGKKEEKKVQCMPLPLAVFELFALRIWTTPLRSAGLVSEVDQESLFAAMILPYSVNRSTITLLTETSTVRSRSVLRDISGSGCPTLRIFYRKSKVEHMWSRREALSVVDTVIAIVANPGPHSASGSESMSRSMARLRDFFDHHYPARP